MRTTGQFKPEVPGIYLQRALVAKPIGTFITPREGGKKGAYNDINTHKNDYIKNKSTMEQS